jgi:integrase
MAKRIKATDADVDRQALASGAYLIMGSAKLDRIRGFMLICNPNSASFVLQRKLWQNGQKRTVRVKLGVRGEITVAEAHAKAVETLKTLNEGLNPNDVDRRASADGRLTLQQVFERYISDGRRAGTLRESTIARYTSHYRNHLAAWGSRTMLELGRAKAEIITLNDRLNEKSGWAAANGTIQLLSYLYRRATQLEDGLLVNPCDAVVLTKEKVRNTALNAADLTAWWTSVMRLSSPVKRAYWLVTALTGGRRTQLASAQWDEIDFSAGEWTFPDEHAKAGRGYRIPLSSFMVEFLTEWRDYVNEYRPETPFIFPGKSKMGCLSRPRNERQGLRASSHPLRHTWETARVGVGLSEMEALLLLGHSLKKAQMSHRYVTREKVDMASLAERQEEMTTFYLQALGITVDSIHDIIWTKVKRGLGKTRLALAS